MSNWPRARTGCLDTHGGSQMRLGCIKYFMNYEVSFVKDSNPYKIEHVFA